MVPSIIHKRIKIKHTESEIELLICSNPRLVLYLICERLKRWWIFLRGRRLWKHFSSRYIHTHTLTQSHSVQFNYFYLKGTIHLVQLWLWVSMIIIRKWHVSAQLSYPFLNLSYLLYKMPIKSSEPELLSTYKASWGKARPDHFIQYFLSIPDKPNLSSNTSVSFIYAFLSQYCRKWRHKLVPITLGEAVSGKAKNRE